MKTFKLNETDSKVIRAAVEQLKENKPVMNLADKAIKATKEIIARELKALRDLTIDSLPEKECVIVEFDGDGGIKIDRKGSDRFDLESFRVVHPELVAKFTKRTVATYFEPLT